MTFYEKMRLVCLRIPRGKVATYGQIAMLCGRPRNSRQVGYGLRENLAGEDIPAFRVVNGRGELSGAQHFVISDLQRTLLAEDGVPTYWNGHCWRVDLKKYGWETSQADAAAFEKRLRPRKIIWIWACSPSFPGSPHRTPPTGTGLPRC